MYFILISAVVSILIFAIAKFLDNGTKIREKTLVFVPEEVDKSGVKIEVFKPQGNEDLEELEKCFARSFIEDPYYCWLFPNEKTRFAGIGWLKFRMVSLTFAFNNVLLATKTENGKRKIIGVGAWEPPGHSSGTPDHIRAGILKIPFVWSIMTFVKILVSARFLDKKDNITKEKNYWYLSHLNVDLPYQGKGIAGKLMQPMLDHADATHTTCVLSVGNPKNLKFYEKFGFAVSYTVESPGLGGPPLWLMTRRPKKE